MSLLSRSAVPDALMAYPRAGPVRDSACARSLADEGDRTVTTHWELKLRRL
jgi:hypothetical protein